MFYNEFAIFVESYSVHFDTIGPSNLTEMVPMIGTEGTTL